jgi:hypothetical protein
MTVLAMPDRSAVRQQITKMVFKHYGVNTVEAGGTRRSGQAGDKLSTVSAKHTFARIHDSAISAPLHPDENARREIAAADYGWKADECYALLQPS